MGKKIHSQSLKIISSGSTLSDFKVSKASPSYGPKLSTNSTIFKSLPLKLIPNQSPISCKQHTLTHSIWLVYFQNTQYLSLLIKKCVDFLKNKPIRWRVQECVAASISHLMFKNCQTGFRNLQLKENYTHLNCHAFLLSVCQMSIFSNALST